ncbi:MAG: cysteine--tRNA ligase [Bacteroidetes bacterium]|nr:cysteine--tRNA ligase [Bacteroidota bacterium]
MNQEIQIYNSLTRKKEIFKPLNPPFVGIYVCGPTVYGHTHLGHARPYITFDVVTRYLRFLGYKVRYVKNITDVGHLLDEVEGTGEDRILKKARLEKLEPMEVAQQYTEEYHDKLHQLNILPPSIEPRASGHIPEQIEMIQKIIDNGFAYVSNGSVYFDVVKYNQTNNYGKLSGRVLEELVAGAGEERRTLEGQEEKHNRADFALWKKAQPEHIMRWKSPWGEGFPGWHIECSAMSSKYLGETFDIHGGGMDLLFPHHECEIAQSNGANKKDPVRYWMHNNLITINGQKMGRSLNNFINLEEFFSGNHPLLTRAYSAMTIRFFMLQAHYRGTLDFSNEALQASEKAFERLMNALHTIEKISPSDKSSVDIKSLRQKCFDAMNDDFNTPIVIANLFEGVRIINSAKDGKETLTKSDLELLKKTFREFIFDVLGLKEEKSSSDNNEVVNNLMNLILEIRKEAKTKKDFQTSDKIREQLSSAHISVKDTKEGANWEIEK